MPGFLSSLRPVPVALLLACHPQPPATTGTPPASLAVPRAPTHASAPRCPVAGTRMPFLARWTPAERDALDAAMHEGIVIVAADDCGGLRVLPRCHAAGRYGYLGIEPRTQTVELATDEEKRVNAPLASTAAPSDATSRPTRFSTSTVGGRQTTRSALAPEELTGECAGATHWVESAGIGAIVVGQTEHDPSAPPEECRAARPGDQTPPARCGAPVGLRISMIDEPDSQMTFAQAPSDTVAPIGTCPSGMVVATDRCVRPPAAGPYLCAFGDVAECRAQCAAGDKNSCDVFGFMQWRGKGMAPDLAAAAATYEKNCARGDAIACGNAAIFSYNGDGVTKGQARAVALLDRGCRLGDTSSCANLGFAYLDGEGSATDETRGWSLLERTCDAGSSSACDMLAARLRQVGPKSDPARALALLTALCDVNVSDACVQLARLNLLGEGVPSDHPRAAKLLERACRVGSDTACVTLGLLYRQADGVDRDDVRATKLMNVACTHGDADGCLNLGIAYEHAKGVDKDPARAASLYEGACGAGVGRACQYLADFLREGTGVAKNGAKAGEMYRKACALGETAACTRGGEARPPSN